MWLGSQTQCKCPFKAPNSTEPGISPLEKRLGLKTPALSLRSLAVERRRDSPQSSVLPDHSISAAVPEIMGLKAGELSCRSSVSPALSLCILVFE